MTCFTLSSMHYKLFDFKTETNALNIKQFAVVLDITDVLRGKVEEPDREHYMPIVTYVSALL